MLKVAKSFICRGCLNPVTSAGRTSVDIGASAKLELVDRFCYLGDMLSVDGDERKCGGTSACRDENGQDRWKWRRVIKEVH